MVINGQTKQLEITVPLLTSFVVPLQSLDLVAAGHVTLTSESVLDQIPQTHCCILYYNYVFLT